MLHKVRAFPVTFVHAVLAEALALPLAAIPLRVATLTAHVTITLEALAALLPTFGSDELHICLLLTRGLLVVLLLRLLTLVPTRVQLVLRVVRPRDLHPVHLHRFRPHHR